jgi:hypothetical protein
MEINPLTAEIHEGATAMIQDDARESTLERMGGEEVVNQLVLSLRNSVLIHHPEIAILGGHGCPAIEAAVYAGMVTGMAAENRARKGDALMREWGVE